MMNFLIRHITISLLILASPVFISASEHAVYLSFSEMSCTDKNPSIQVKVFSDDLESALKNFTDGQPAEKRLEIEDLIEAYFTKYLIVIFDNKRMGFSLTRMKVENDAHFITFQMSTTSSPEKIKIKADFFMELFPTQQNVMNIKIKEQSYYMRLSKSDPEQSIILPSR